MSPSQPPNHCALPVIDISSWIKPSSDCDDAGSSADRAQTASAIHNACLNYGFFYLNLSSFIEPNEMEELISLAKQFFGLPSEQKERLHVANQDGSRGYRRLGKDVTSQEALEFYAPVAEPDKKKCLWGENQWPTDDMVPAFREKLELWMEKMKILGLTVMEAMSVGLGLTHDEWVTLRSKVNNSFWAMRAIGYPPISTGFDKYSCYPHRDYGCLTFLYADGTPNSLQVFIPQQIQFEVASDVGTSGSWIDINPLPGCVVCNIGEMWEIWTNGLYKSTLHRVIHRGTNHRISIPFFFEPNFDALIEPLPTALRQHEKYSQQATTPSRHFNVTINQSLTSSLLSSGAGGEIVDYNGEITNSGRVYEPVVYGEYLTRMLSTPPSSKGKAEV